MLQLSRAVLAVVACLAISAPNVAAQEVADAPSVPAADAADVESIEAILTSVYDVISGPAGEPRDWDRMRSLFVPEAQLIPVQRTRDGRIVHRVLGVEDYVEGAGEYLETNGFFERELARRTEEFAHIAHAFSTYESFHNEDDSEPFSRGINSFQLMHDGSRWWIVSIYWTAENEEYPIPERYLP
jgi:hypothetical protein